MTKQILVRHVPVEVHDWIEAERSKSLATQSDFVVAALKSIKEGDQELPLFALRRSVVTPSPSGLPFSFVDLFAGIGGFRIGLSLVGGRCVFTSEWEKHAQRTYHAWFGEVPQGDIEAIDPHEIPDHDVLAAGFPCQPFSIAGVSKKKSLGQAHGFDCKRQGNLFFTICDIVKAKRPPVLLLENVKNLKSHDGGRTWSVITSSLRRLNYVVFHQIIDAAAWVPQHRERIFLVCFDREVFGNNPPFEFPISSTETPPTLRAILEPDPDPKYTLTDHLWNYLQRYAEKHRAKGNGFGYGLVGPEDVTRTLSARYYKDGSEILIRQARKNPRRLTHREAARLMGFTEEIAQRFGHEGGFPLVVSDTQGYKQFGNAVVPQVVRAIGAKIVDVLVWHLSQRTGGCLIKIPSHKRHRRVRERTLASV